MKAFVWILCLFLCNGLYAEVSKKEYRGEFDKAAVREVMILNKNGAIEVEQIAGDSVYVVADVSVVAKTQSKADELIEFIEIREDLSDGYLKVETEFLKDMTFRQLVSGVELKISYKVSLPQGIKLRLVNTDGNVFVDNFDGDLDVDMKTCNFRGGDIKGGEFKVRQTNGNFKVTKAENLRGEFKGCVVRIENAGEVQMVADNCEGRFESVTKLDIRSTGGDMRLGQIEDMNGTSSSTKYEIQDIGNSLKMDMKMGEINVRNIHFAFSFVDITGSYSKVGLSFMEGAGYQLEFKHTKSVRTDVPASFGLKKQPTSEKNMIVETGFVGDKKYKGKVTLNLRNGNMYIQ